MFVTSRNNFKIPKMRLNFFPKTLEKCNKKMSWGISQSNNKRNAKNLKAQFTIDLIQG